MDPIILTAVIAGGVAFLFVLAGKPAWFIRKMEEEPRDGAPVRSDEAVPPAQRRTGQEAALDADSDTGNGTASSD